MCTEENKCNASTVPEILGNTLTLGMFYFHRVDNKEFCWLSETLKDLKFRTLELDITGKEMREFGREKHILWS